MRTLGSCGFAITLAVAAGAQLLAQSDKPGATDHPLLTRMPGYYIENHQQSEFDKYKFVLKDGQASVVEGRKTEIVYYPKKGVTAASPLQIVRNCQNAMTKIGGTVLFETVGSGGGRSVLKLVRGTNEVWTEVAVGDGGNNYGLVIVEKGEMKQEVVASADLWKSELGEAGRAAVYGIYFDTDQSVIKPGSEAALEEIAKLLRQNPRLSLLVVGHTDITGEIPHNLALSDARAKAVVKALVDRHGIQATRLAAYGCGPLAPVASNDTEAGRAKNRRVDLVKR